MTKNVLITGINSDIGKYLASQYYTNGYKVYGTYHQEKYNQTYITQLKYTTKTNKLNLKKIGTNKLDLIINCIGTQKPIGPLLQQTPQEIEESIQINLTMQIKILPLLKNRLKKHTTIIYLAGPATNGTNNNYIPYSLSKVALIKLTELLAQENPQHQITAIGTGPVKTKMLKQTIQAGIKKSGKKRYTQTQKILNNQLPSTNPYIIYRLIETIRQHPKETTGRNISLVNDQWCRPQLYQALKKDKNMYKLRRYKNDIQI